VPASDLRTHRSIKEILVAQHWPPDERKSPRSVLANGRHRDGREEGKVALTKDQCSSA
jgi:hypothetical protein